MKTHSSGGPNRARRQFSASLACAPLLASGFAQAADTPPAPRPLLDFFREPTLSDVEPSPEATHIAGLRLVNDCFNLVVVDVATRKALIVTNYEKGDVGGFEWINNDTLAYWTYDRRRGGGDQVGSEWMVIRRDGSAFRELDGWPVTRVRDREGRYTNEVIVRKGSAQALSQFSSDLYRLDVWTGRSHLLTMGGPRQTVGWVVDRRHVPRAAVSSVKGTSIVYLRANEQAPWREIFRFGQEEEGSTVHPIAFDAAGALYVSAYNGRENKAIWRFDDATGRLEEEPVFAIAGFDLNGGLIFDRRGERLLGLRYEADRAGVYWLDPELRALQERVDALLPGLVNRLAVDGHVSEGPVLVSSWSDREPGRHYLFDRRNGQLQQIAADRPWIDPEGQRPTKTYRYKARDGLSIPAQLTLPQGTGPFPLVVLHYGGPWVRPTHWHWDPAVQFLASRGYAVMMPAPRGSTGFGATLFKRGWRQWGLGMQDDVTDGVRELIARGIVDEKRVAIAGASYGGYLAMMALAKEPTLFKCAVNWVGVTDPGHMFSVAYADFNIWDSGRYDLPVLVGDPDKDAEQFKRTSPVARAAEIHQPVLMAYGHEDRRVPLVNGERMRDALKPHNKQVEWVVYPDEGHGWLKLSTKLDFWARVEKFLATYL